MDVNPYESPQSSAGRNELNTSRDWLRDPFHPVSLIVLAAIGFSLLAMTVWNAFRHYCNQQRAEAVLHGLKAAAD